MQRNILDVRMEKYHSNHLTTHVVFWLRLVAVIAVGVGWALVANYAASQDLRWLYDAGSPWALVAFVAGWLMPFQAIWTRMLGSVAALCVGLVIYYAPYPPPVLWIGFALVAGVCYGAVAWLRARGMKGWSEPILPAAVGGPFFLEAVWSAFTPYDVHERGWPFAIVGLTASVAVATSWRGRILGPIAAAIAGSAVLALIWLIAGADLATELL
jgi:hypothetical protein